MKRVLLALFVCGCSSGTYSDGALHIKWTMPPGVKLQSEGTEGAVTTAHFSGGVDVRSVAAAPPSTEGDLDALKTSLLAAAKMTAPGEVRMERSGTIPNGPTVRWEMWSPSDRTLLYYVPGKDRYLLIAMVSPAAAFDRKSDKFELSLSSLKME